MDFQWLKNIIGKLDIQINQNKVNSPSSKKKTVIKAGQIVQNNGLSYSEAKEVMELVVDQKISEFKGVAEQVFTERIHDFMSKTLYKLKNIDEDKLENLKDPAVQFSLREAATISGKKKDDDIRDVLSSLVINRIENADKCKEDLKDIVYNEAITTVGKLTIDQLKIITLCYLLRYTKNEGVVDLASYKNYLNTTIKPLIDFKNTASEFTHIVYAGCGSKSIGSWNLFGSIRSSYPFLFYKGFKYGEIDNESFKLIENFPEIMQEIEGRRYFVSRDEEQLVKYLKDKKVDDENINTIMNVYKNNIMDDTESRELISEIETGKKILEVEKSDIQYLSLTTVGIVIAAAYLEKITDIKVNIDIWIN